MFVVCIPKLKKVVLSITLYFLIIILFFIFAGKKQKSLNKPKDDDDVNIHDQQPKNKRKRSVLEEKMKNLEQQPVELDLVSTSKVIRLTQGDF